MLIHAVDDLHLYVPAVLALFLVGETNILLTSSPIHICNKCNNSAVWGESILYVNPIIQFFFRCCNNKASQPTTEGNDLSQYINPKKGKLL